MKSHLRVNTVIGTLVSDLANAAITKTTMYGFIMLHFISQVPTVALPSGTQEQLLKFTVYKSIIIFSIRE